MPELVGAWTGLRAPEGVQTELLLSLEPVQAFLDPVQALAEPVHPFPDSLREILGHVTTASGPVPASSKSSGPFSPRPFPSPVSLRPVSSSTAHCCSSFSVNKGVAATVVPPEE